MRNASPNNIKTALRTLLASVLSLMLVFSLGACKPTDLFTEIVITPFSDVIDYKNPQTLQVNSPDATKESAELTALDWTDESPRSINEENLVTYSDEPTSLLTAHHSLFDLSPRFPGIRSSDPVRLIFSTESPLDHESEAKEQDVTALQAAARSAGGAEGQDSNATPSDNATSGEGSDGGEEGGDSGGDETGNNPNGSNPDPENPGGGSGPENPDGPGEDPYGGYNGEVETYDPGNAFSKVNRVDHLATLGTDVSVMAQSLGGAGAICAMNEYAYYGLDASGLRTTTYKRFVDVFAGEMPTGFEQNRLLWSGTGSSPANVINIDTLVSACGPKGLIVYDQKLGNANTLFSLDQRKRLQAAEIQLAPVDMSTVQGMLDAAQVIGDALSESTECAQDAQALSKTYQETVNDLVRFVTNTHDGNLAQFSDDGKGILTSYNFDPLNPPFREYDYYRVYGYIATESESGLTYTGSPYVDASRIVLFGNNSAYKSTPLSFWMQAAGVYDGTVSPGVPQTGLMSFWPFRAGVTSTTLVGGRSGGAYSRWLGTRGTSATPNPLTLMNGLNHSPTSALTGGMGLGSSQVPYLIVAGSDGKSAAQVKGAVVDSMLSFDYGGSLTPYSVLLFDSNRNPIWLPPGGNWSDNHAFTIGDTSGTTTQSPFYSSPPLAVGDVVRENPIGLLGSWTEGNMESVLEAVWLADIYSKSPIGCDYSPITNMSGFSVSIGGANCTTTRETVRQFYWTFYRCDIDAPGQSVYNDIVTDEGLL